MVQFVQSFLEPKNVASLMRQLSWTHFLQLIPLKIEQMRNYCAQHSAEQRWSVRELRQHMAGRPVVLLCVGVVAQLHVPFRLHQGFAARVHVACAERDRLRAINGDVATGFDLAALGLQALCTQVAYGLDFNSC